MAASLVLLLLRVARPRGTFLGKVKVHSHTAPELESREVYVPLNPSANVVNPHLQVIPPAPGVILYRFEESYLYPNSSILNSVLVDYAKATTRRGRDLTGVSASERPWNDPGPRKGAVVEDDSHKPLLRAVVLDFSGMYVPFDTKTPMWMLTTFAVHISIPRLSKVLLTPEMSWSGGWMALLRYA